MRPPRTQTSSAPQLPHAMRSALFVVLAFIVVAVGAVVLRSTLLGSGEVDASAELALLREEVSPLLVYSEFGQWADTVWAADPDDPGHRAYVASIEHRSGFGISASLSPDGTTLAYIVLPRGASRSDPAELWTKEIGTTNSKKLAEDVDLLTDPVWTPASDAVVIRRPTGIETSNLVLVDLDGNESTLTQGIAAPFPIGFAPDGQSLYVATLSASGTELVRVPRGGGTAAALTQLSTGFSRDWSVSPDGRQVAYLAQTSGNSLSYTAEVYDVDGDETRGAVAGLSGSQFNPVWHPDGGLTVGSAPATEAAGAMVHALSDGAGGTAGVLAGPETGFDVPLSWSTDGSYLIVRNFEGDSASDPGPSHVVIINSTGLRLQLSAQSDVLVIGWLD